MAETVSRRQEPPHLYLRPLRYKPDGKLWKKPVWIIVDGKKEVNTGCGLEDREGAETSLAEYIGDKHAPSHRKGQNIDDILFADVVAIFLPDKVPDQKRPEKAAERFEQIFEWWGEKTPGDVNGRSCRDYTAWRCTHAWKAA